MIATLTPEQQKALAQECLDFFGPTGGRKQLSDALKQMEDTSRKLGETIELNNKAFLEAMEKERAARERMAQQIRSRRGPGYVPGLEDEAKRFSMARFMGAICARDWKHAGFEKEVVDQAIQRIPESMRQRIPGASVGTDPSVGYLIPDQVLSDQIIEPFYRRSAFLALDAESGETNVSVLDGLPVSETTIPKFLGGAIAYWHGEAQAPTGSTVKAATMTLKPRKLSVLIQLTEEMRAFASPGVDRLVNRDIMRALAAKVDFTIPYGAGGDHIPRGITKIPGVRIYSHQNGGSGQLLDPLTGNLGASPFQADWAGKALDIDTISNMRLVLEEANIMSDSAMTIMAPRARLWLAQLRVLNYSGQTTGQPYLLPIGINDAALASLIGPWRKASVIPSNLKPGASVGATSTAAAKATDIFHGDMSEILFGRTSGLWVRSDNGTGAEFKEGIENVKVTMFCDVGMRHPEAVIVCPDALVRA